MNLNLERLLVILEREKNVTIIYSLVVTENGVI